MTRQEAHDFIKLYRKFQDECPGVKLIDLISDTKIEVELPTGLWKIYDDWNAAKVIEAHTQHE